MALKMAAYPSSHRIHLHHALVNLIACLVHELTTVLRTLQTEGGNSAVRKGKERALGSTQDLFLNFWAVGVKDRINDGGTSCRGEEGRSKPKHAASGHQILDN